MERRLRHLARSLDASRIFVDLAISRDRFGRHHDEEHWPRSRNAPSRLHLRRVGLLLSSIVVAAAVTQQIWSTHEAPRVPPRIPVPAASPISVAPPVPSEQRPVIASSAVIHIKALRPCSVRLVVDRTALSWRMLQAGDEFFSRPQQQLTIETDDWDALHATLNGQPVLLGPGHNVIRVN